MTPESQRIAIAAHLGWQTSPLPFERHCCKLDSPNGTFKVAWWHEKVAGCQWQPPDYLSDLNAMHEAEKVLTQEQGKEYTLAVMRIVNVERGWATVDAMLRASAAQRAEAFLKTLGLWKENE